jgi:hypothetical protein
MSTAVLATLAGSEACASELRANVRHVAATSASQAIAAARRTAAYAYDHRPSTTFESNDRYKGRLRKKSSDPVTSVPHALKYFLILGAENMAGMILEFVLRTPVTAGVDREKLYSARRPEQGCSPRRVSYG